MSSIRLHTGLGVLVRSVLAASAPSLPPETDPCVYSSPPPPRILSVVPSALIILLGLWRLNSIRRQAFQLPTLARMSVKAKIVTAVKLCTSLGLLFCNIAILATSPRGEKVTPTLHAATSLALATSVRSQFHLGRGCAHAKICIQQALTIVLSWEEHFRTTASSPLLPIYLLTTLLCDAARVRTFALQGETKSRFFAAFCASVALRFLFFVGENVEKGWMVKEKRAGGKVRANAEQLGTGVSS